MMDPVNMQRMAELRQQEYLAIAEQLRNTKPLRITLAEAANKVVARLSTLTHTAPAAPEMTEACVEC